MSKKIIWATLGYTVVTFALGASWHFVFFPQVYHEVRLRKRH